MTELECVKIIAVIEAAYPRYYMSITEDAKKNMLTVWHKLLKDYSYEEVGAAVYAVINSSKYPPVIADITERLQSFYKTDELSELEAWALVRNAVTKNGYYGYREDFAKFPKVIQKSIGTAETLKYWSQLDESEFNTVIQSNFVRSYRVEVKRDSEYQRLPGSVKEFIGGIIEKKKLAQAQPKAEITEGSNGP